MTEDPRLREALGLGALSAIVGGMATLPLAMAPVGAVVAGVNGCVCGWKGIYELGSRKGWWDWLRDSTWALPTTGAGMVMVGLQALRSDSNYVEELSKRQGRLTYGGGWRFRKGYATSIGPVVINAFDGKKLSPLDPTWPRRSLLVTRHEEQHVRQARRYGPFFPMLYSAWLGTGFVRALWWKIKGDEAPIGQLILTSSYFLNPFEKTAYKKDQYWPPSGLLRHRLR